MSGSASRNEGRTVALCLAVIAVMFLWHAFGFWHYINDDAYITFRYSRFLALGRGPYFNIGEHVEGYTNVLVMLLTSAFILILGPDLAPAAAKMVGVLSGAGCVLLAHRITSELLGRKTPVVPKGAYWGLAAAGIVAVSPAFAVNTTSGLETALFSFLLTLGALLGSRESTSGRWRGSGLAFGAAALTRPEGVVLFTAFWCGQALAHFIRHVTSDDRSFRTLLTHRGTRTLVLNGAIVTAFFAGLILFRHLAYDGEWLPNTYYAKERDVTFWQARRYVELGMLPAVFGVIGVGVAGVGFLARLKRVTPWLPIISITAMGCIVPFLSGTDWMLGARLVIPYLPFLAVCVVSGWALLTDLALRRFSGVALLAAILLLPVLWHRQAGERRVTHEHIALRARGYQTGHIALSDWIRNETAEPGDTVALMDIGLVGYRCIDQHVLDLTGLTDRHIAKRPGGFLSKQYDPAYVLDQSPRLIVLSLSAQGESYTPPPPGTEFGFWTDIEKRIYDHPEFQAHYLSRNPNAKPGLEAVAEHYGASRIFEHGHPGMYYLLAVFERQEGS